MKRIVIGLLMLALLSAGCTTAPSNEEKSTISVTASGSVKAVPDNAVISFSVVTQDTDAGTAMADNAALMNTVVEAVKGQGIEDEKVRTSQVSLIPQYAPYDPEKPLEDMREIVGYRTVNSVEVTVEDTTMAGSIIDTAVEAGANQVQNLYFTFSEEKQKEVYQEALTEAASEARGKADSIADALNVKIIGPFKVTESGYYPGPIYRMSVAEEAMAGGAPTPVSPGEQEITASVTVEYEIG